MQSVQYKIKKASGMDEQPAGRLVKKAKEYSSMIYLDANDKLGDAKRIFGVIGLGIRRGDEVLICADGSDECRAVVELADFFSKNL